MCDIWKIRYIGQWDQVESPEIDLHMNSELNFNMPISYLMGKDVEKISLNAYLAPYWKLNSNVSKT